MEQGQHQQGVESFRCDLKLWRHLCLIMKSLGTWPCSTSVWFAEQEINERHPKIIINLELYALFPIFKKSEQKWVTMNTLPSK